MIFRDRTDAGQQLARALESYKKEELVILGLARGGLPVALEIAKFFEAPLDVIVVRKLGVPSYAELGFGAIAPGIVVYNDDILRSYPISQQQIEMVKTEEEVELARRVKEYRGKKEGYNLKGKTVILVDDGVATGITVLAAIRYVRSFEPQKVVIGAPVCAPDTLQALRAEADDLVFLTAPMNFSAVAQWYESFPQVSDGKVKEILGMEGDRTLNLSRDRRML